MCDEWTDARIDELGNGLRPVLKAGPFGSSVTKATYQASGYKVYGQQEVVAKDLNAEAYFVSEATFLRHKSCAVKPGDLLMTMMGTIGRVYQVPEGAPEGIINPRLVRLAFDTSRILPEYAEVALEQPPLQRLLDRRSHGGTMQGLNLEALASIRLPLPPLLEQRKIAEILAAWDAAIEKTDQLIAAKEKQKYGVMAALLSAKRRLSGFGTPWRHWHLGELFRERVEPNRVDLPLLSITSNEGVVLRADLDRKDTSSEDKSKYLRICPGDIGYNTMRMWQGVSALSRHEGIVSPAYTVCIPGPDIDGRFASYLFKLPSVIHLFYRYSQGLTSDTWNLKFHHFAEIRVRIPKVDEQIAIASVLAAMDEELAKLKKQRDALVQQKRGLMQKLLTGQWRVNTTKEGAA